MKPFGFPSPEAFTTSAPMKGGTTIAYLNGSFRPSVRRISPGTISSIATSKIASIFCRLKNMPSIFSPPGSPPIPKCPGKGSALT